MIVQVYVAFNTNLFYKHFKKTRFKDFEGLPKWNAKISEDVGSFQRISNKALKMKQKYIRTFKDRWKPCSKSYKRPEISSCKHHPVFGFH